MSVNQIDIEPEIRSFTKSSDAFVSAHFRAREFDCKNCVCQTTLISTDLVNRLEKLREILGKPISIRSGFRCARKQAQLRAQGYETSVGVSQHEFGKAADIEAEYTNGLTMQQFAIQAGFDSIGTAQWWIHVDLRQGRRWVYAQNSGKKLS